MKSRITAALAIFLALIALSMPPADAAVRYDVVDLGQVEGASINAAGEVAGTGRFAGLVHAFVWNRKFTDLRTLAGGVTSDYSFQSSAVRVDAGGRVYGTSDFLHTPKATLRAAFFWDGKIHAVPLPPKAISCNGTSANTGGDIVGLCYLGPPARWRAFIYSHGVSKLFAPPGWGPLDINKSGEILLTNRNGVVQLYYHGAFHALEKSFNSTRLNDAGFAAGWLSVNNNQGADAAYFDGTHYADLGALPGFPFTSLSALNLKGAGVGSAADYGGNERAVYYDATAGIVDLNSAVDPGLGIVLNKGIDINDRGRIITMGGPTGHLLSHCYLLVPRT